MKTSLVQNLPIYPDKFRSFLPQTFLFGKVMHGISRQFGFVGAIGFIGATSHNISLLSCPLLCSLWLLCSFVDHETIIFRATNYITSCVR